MKGEMILRHIQTPCRKCGNRGYEDTERDSEGFHNVICKECKTINFRYSDKGDSFNFEDLK